MLNLTVGRTPIWVKFWKILLRWVILFWVVWIFHRRASLQSSASLIGKDSLYWSLLLLYFKNTMNPNQGSIPRCDLSRSVRSGCLSTYQQKKEKKIRSLWALVNGFKSPPQPSMPTTDIVAHQMITCNQQWIFINNNGWIIYQWLIQCGSNFD